MHQNFQAYIFSLMKNKTQERMGEWKLSLLRIDILYIWVSCLINVPSHEVLIIFVK